MPTVEEIVEKALQTGKGFTLSYVLDFDDKKGELDLLAAGGRESFEVEPLGYTPLADRVEAVVEKHYGALSYEGGDFRQESKGNAHVRVHFDPGWGSFQIHVRPR